MDNSKEQIARFVAVFHKIRRFNDRGNVKFSKMTKNEYILLFLLNHQAHTEKQNEMTITEVAEMMQLGTSTISPLVHSLFTKGYIERAASLEDRRVSNIKLTKEGKIVVKKVIKNMDTLLIGVFDEFGKEKTEQLINLLEEFGEAFDKVNLPR